MSFVPIYQKLGIGKEIFQKQLEEFCKQDRPVAEMAEFYGINKSCMHIWLNKFGLKRNGLIKREKWRNKEWLYEQYIVHERSTYNIAKEVGVDNAVIGWNLRHKGIVTRDLSTALKLRFDKTPCELHKNLSSKSRGYSFWYDDIYFRSAAEFTWYLVNKNEYESIEYEPFIYLNKKPDFLVNKTKIFELKGPRRNYTEQQIKEWLSYGHEINKNFGYTYDLVFIDDHLLKEYLIVKHNFRKLGFTTKTPFKLEDDATTWL